MSSIQSILGQTRLAPFHPRMATHSSFDLGVTPQILRHWFKAKDTVQERAKGHRVYQKSEQVFGVSFDSLPIAVVGVEWLREMVASGTNSFAKEMAVRKRIGSIYNKREEDFSSLREYNDYLEEVEEMIVDLVEGINVTAIESRISQYQKENSEQIMNAQARKAEEYAAALAASKGGVTQKDFELEAPSSNAAVTQGGHYAPAIAQQPRPMGMGPQPMPLSSGLGNEYEDEEMMKLRCEKAARAGGWSIEITRKRALEDAFSSIWI